MTHDSKGYPTWLHTAPKSQGAYNAIRRMRQITDLAWSPAAGDKIRREYYLPAGSYEDTREHGLRDVSQFFSPDKVYKGLPYSRYNFIGLGNSSGRKFASIETFATAATNELSVLMQQSYDIRDYGSAYYGTDCSMSVSYALGLPQVTTALMDRMPGLNYLYDISENGVYHNIDDLELADVLLLSDSHCAMVTDIIKDDSGKVTYVEVSENSMTYLGYARRWMWEKQEFLEWFADFAVYRYGALDTIEYTPNPFVPMPDEGNLIAYTDYRVMPFRGNKAIYVESSKDTPDGETVPTPSIALIVRNLVDGNVTGNPLAFTHILIRKNGEDWGDPIEIDASKGIEPYIISGIALDQDEANYTACLVAYSDGTITKQTDPCEWCYMPQRTPTVTFSDGVLTIVVTIKNTQFVPAYFIAAREALTNYTAVHITPDMFTTVTNADGSITYTITRGGYAADRIINRLLVGYTSTGYGTVRETYELT
jgi:hypothetical protein